MSDYGRYIDIKERVRRCTIIVLYRIHNHMGFYVAARLIKKIDDL